MWVCNAHILISALERALEEYYYFFFFVSDELKIASLSMSIEIQILISNVCKLHILYVYTIYINTF